MPFELRSGGDLLADDGREALQLQGMCGCSICMGGGGGEPQTFLAPTSGTANGLPALSWDQAAAQLARAGASWSAMPGTPVTVTYAFRSSIPADQYAQVPAGVSGFAPFSAAQILVTEAVLQLWADVANINFIRVGAGTTGAAAYSNNATMLFGNFTSGPDAFSAFAFLPAPGATGALNLEGDLWFNQQRPAVSDPSNPAFGGARLLSHEIGHTLGLLHPADYGGGANSGRTYENDAQHWQDTAMFTNMSYFGAHHTGGNPGATPWTPMLHDIAAAQLLYGANMSTRTGDTVYGFNSNSDRAALSIASAAQGVTFAIWDSGGIDTLDFSGYSSPSEIDLRAEAFSSVGPGQNGGVARYNVSIARGVVIENAIGGSGADTLIGNDIANMLNGNGGADTLNGGSGADVLDGGAGADVLNGEAGDDVIFWDASDAQINGGADVDTLAYTSGSAPTSFNLSANGFERAEGRLSDPGPLQPWASQTLLYTSAWQLDYHTIVNDDATRSEMDYDQANAFAWSSNFDQDDAFAWATIWRLYDSNGVLINQVITPDPSGGATEGGLFGM